MILLTDADGDDVDERLSGAAFERAGPDTGGEVIDLVQDGVDIGHHVLPVHAHVLMVRVDTKKTTARGRMEGAKANQQQRKKGTKRRTLPGIVHTKNKNVWVNHIRTERTSGITFLALDGHALEKRLIRAGRQKSRSGGWRDGRALNNQQTRNGAPNKTRDKSEKKNMWEKQIKLLLY